jgi:hypothetical protein
MVNDFELLTGAMSWKDFEAARERFLDRFSHRAHLEHGRNIMGLQ